MLLLKDPPELYKLPAIYSIMAQNNELQTDIQEYMQSLVKSYEEMMTKNEVILYKMLVNECAEDYTVEKYLIAIKILSRRYAGLRKKWRAIVHQRKENEQFALSKERK